MSRRLVVLVLALVLAGGLAACGGDDDGGTVERAPTTSAFCRKMRSADRPFDDLEQSVDASGVPSREVLLEEATSVDRLAATAPAPVRADLVAFAQAVRQIADLRGQVDLSDEALADPKNAAKLQTMSTEMDRLGKQVQAVSVRVAKYLHDECGIDTGTTTSSTTTTTTAAATTTLG